MEKLERGDEIVLEDNRSFGVVDSFDYKDKHYLFLVSTLDNKSTMMVELENDEVIVVENKRKLDSLYEVLIERNKDEISKYLKEINEN